MDPHKKTIYLGAGCFWCTEATFQALRGVLEVIPGYMGGTVPNPSYEAVSSGTTGHVEVAKIVYDDSQLPTEVLLEIFFALHDPTTPNRQGADIGSQYRSAIFYTEELMREIAVRAVQKVQGTLPEGEMVVTHVIEASDFYLAEHYHQNYYQNHKDAPYCQLVINPKLEKLKEWYGAQLK